MKKSIVPSRHTQTKGQSLAEYGLILALIAIVCISALQILGQNISGSLTQIGSALSGAMKPPANG